MSDFLARMVDRAAGRARPVEPVVAPRWGNVTPLEAPPEITATVERGVVQRMPASASPAPVPPPSVARAATPSRAAEPAPGSAARPLVESERAQTIEPSRASGEPKLGDATIAPEPAAPLRPIVRAPLAIEEELQVLPSARAHADAIDAARPVEAARSIDVARAVEPPHLAARPAAPFAPAPFAPPAAEERALAPHETLAPAAPFANTASSPLRATPSALRANAPDAVEPATPRAAPIAPAPRFDLTQALQAAVRALSTPPRTPAPATVEPAAADEIHISIGRVDVRATAPAERPAPPSRPSHLKPLDDYLRAPFGSKL
jgi:hypothetical protein